MRKLAILLTLLLVGVAPVPRGGADVHIVFSGLICHVFDEGHAPRAVAMRGTEAMPHRATLHVAENAVASSDLPLACEAGDCTLDLANTALRFAGSGRAKYDRGGSFDTIVPHLRAITGGEMRSLRDDVFADVPSPASPVLASMELPSGRMSATAYDMRGKYEPDLEGRGERQYAREVFFDGHIAKPLLLVRRAGDAAWHRITFREDDGLIELRVASEPADGMANDLAHATLFYDLAAMPLAVRPAIMRAEIVRPEPGRRLTANLTTPGCSNSTYP